ncbi:MAG: hemerythrin domain-containing protein [Burkholderiales bacterium]
MPSAIANLRAEHRSISAVLSGLRELARMARESSTRPDFAALRAMIFYIDEFPEKLHHPKEDKYLFARLLARAPQAAALIDRLRGEHVEGARRLRDLERAVLGVEQTWPEGTAQFQAAVDDYAEFQWRHMRCEEQELLPLAERSLMAEDWAAIEAAFAANDDPLAGVGEREYRRLFQRITQIAPAPVGLGAPWK